METESTTTPPIKALGIILGSTFLAMGGQPLVNYLSGDSALKTALPSLLICGLGLFLIVGSILWRPNLETSGKFVQTLARWANSPIPYATIIFLIWVYFETVALQRNNEIV